MIVIAESKQNRKNSPDVPVADLCQPKDALKHVFDTDLLHSALLFRVHPKTADAFPIFDFVNLDTVLKNVPPNPSEIRK